MRIKHIYVNHEDETFAILTAAQAIDMLYSMDNTIEVYGSPFGGIFNIDEESRRIEFFRDSEWIPFESFNKRVKDLSSCYTDITDFFETIEG